MLPVAEYMKLLAAHHPLHKNRNHATLPYAALPGAVYIGETEAQGIQIEDFLPFPAVQLPDPFVDAVRRQRVAFLRLLQRSIFVHPVYGCGRGKDKLFNFVPFRQLQHIGQSQNIGLGIKIGILQRMHHIDLCSQMHYNIELVAFEQFLALGVFHI
ncbi:hypothetical protein D3C81_1738390 [compost metagenome]